MDIQNKYIAIPDNIETDINSFASIHLKITCNDKTAIQQYYLHKCKQKEFIETVSEEIIEQSKDQLQTIFFLNEDQESTTLQINSKRVETNDETSATEEKTLYFINEEES